MEIHQHEGHQSRLNTMQRLLRSGSLLLVLQHRSTGNEQGNITVDEITVIKQYYIWVMNVPSSKELLYYDEQHGVYEAVHVSGLYL